MEIIEAEVLWNYLPQGNLYALIETDKDLAEFFNLIPEENHQLVISKDNPKNAYVIQGQVVFVNKRTQNIFYTNESVCIANQDILHYSTGEQQCHLLSFTQLT